MSSLTGSSISGTYGQLLALPGGGGGGPSGGLKELTDGNGATTFALKLASDKISIGEQHKLYFDGGNDTYIHENSGDELDFVVGGNTLLRIEELGGGGNDRVHVQSNVKLVIGNSDTYFIENPDDHLQLIVGSQQMMMWDQDETAGGYGTITVGVDGEGCDFKLFGETSGAYMLWDQSEDYLELDIGTADGTCLKFNSSNNRVKDIVWDDGGSTKGRIRFHDDTSGTDANDRLELGTASDLDTLVIKNGKVGIATATPNTTLHVAGSFAASGPSESPVVFAAVDASPSVATGNLFISGSSTETIESFDDGTIGQIITIYSNAAITYSHDAGNLSCGTHDIVTAVGDITRWVKYSSNWHIISWIDHSENLSGAGGF